MTERHLTECGLPGVGQVPYGLHACHFYRDRAELVAALAAAWPGVHDAIARGALRVLDFDQWYSKGADLVECWLEEERSALAEGYSGLRITGNTSFVQRSGWARFMDYERSVSERLLGRRIVALCSYTLRGRRSGEVAEVMQAHGCTLERADATWQVVSSGTEP